MDRCQDTIMCSGNDSAIHHNTFGGNTLSSIPMINWGPGPLHPLVLSADAMFLYCSYIVFTSAHSAQKYAKIAIFIALFAFIPGVI